MCCLYSCNKSHGINYKYMVKKCKLYKWIGNSIVKQGKPKFISFFSFFENAIVLLSYGLNCVKKLVEKDVYQDPKQKHQQQLQQTTRGV